MGQRKGKPLGMCDVTGSVADLAAEQTVLQKRHQDLIRDHMSIVLARLFAEFTGLHFHVSWVPPVPHTWCPQTLPSRYSAYCRKVGTHATGCERCARRQLALTLRNGRQGHEFTCRWGVRSFWLPLAVQNVVVGIAFVQALDGRLNGTDVHDGSATKLMTRTEFTRAARLLRLILQHAETAALVDLEKSALALARQELTEQGQEAARLRKELHRICPDISEKRPTAAHSTHTEQVVLQMLNCIHEHYAEPITLKRCADKLGMNPAYLSDLFSRTVGLPFRTYLTEFRLEKAKALLSDPAKRVSEAAFAVGYTSQNCFLVAFKKATGLTPSQWRETFRV